MPKLPDLSNHRHPDRPPVKKLTSGDYAWLFTKVLLFLGTHVATLLVAVCTATAVGGITLQETQNKLFGLLTGIGTFMACLAGRELVIAKVVLTFFNKKDIEDMDKVINDGERK